MTSAPAPRRRFRSRLLLVACALLGCALLLELVMQAGAFALWLVQRQPVEEVTGRSVLCVGDSWTHGMGSAEPLTGSYPARVETLLRAAGVADCTVVNGGQSGQNSRDVLERLPSQLAQVKPRVVCVLVGVNDFWSQPELLPETGGEAADHTSYRFRWRLPRLVAWALGNLRGGASPEVSRDAAAWAPRPLPGYADPYGKEPSDWQAGPPEWALKEAGWKAWRAGDFAATRKAFEQLLVQAPGDPQVHMAMAMLHRREGHQDDLQRELEWMRAAWRTRGGYWTGSSLAKALDEAGLYQENLDLLEPLLGRFPQAADLWHVRAKALWQVGRNDEALRAIDRSLELRFDPWSCDLRHRILLLGLNDVDGAIGAIITRYLADNDARRFAELVRAMSAPSPERVARARELVAQRDADPAARARMDEILGDVQRSLDGRGAAEVLTRHLERIAIACRNAGAVPVLLCYPWTNDAEPVLRQAAATLGFEFIDVAARFAERRGDRPVAELRSSDGHFNDAGYEIMAGIVAERLLPLLTRAPGGR